MQRHTFSFEVDATPDEVWRVLHPKAPPTAEHPRVIEHGDVRIEILEEGDEHGKGLVRHCWFPVPKYLLSGGVGQSWELITEANAPVSSRYEAIGKPLWSTATGSHRIEAVGEGRTRVTFEETYHAFNPVMRLLFERRVHAFISKDNDRLVRQAVEEGVAARRRRQAERAERAGQAG